MRGVMGRRHEINVVRADPFTRGSMAKAVILAKGGGLRYPYFTTRPGADGSAGGPLAS